MTKLLWLSDLHFVAEGLVEDHDPRQRLASAVEHINAHHRDAEFCVVSGDLVDRGTVEDYCGVAAGLNRLAMPWLPMVGNHDNRALVRQHCPVPKGGMAQFIQYAVPADAARVVCLDTLTPGDDHGTFCAARLDWLGNVLAKDPDTPTLIFMHHPPMDLGLPMQDRDRLQEAEPLLDLLTRHKQVMQLCIGHVHRPIAGSLCGLPFATMRAVLYQAPPPVPAWDWESFKPAREAPALGVITLRGGDIQIHYEQFCAAD